MLFARREVNLQWFFVRPPVLKTRGMTKHVAGSYEFESRIALEKRLRRILGQRRIKTDDASFTEFHHRVSKHGLAHGRGFKDRLVINRFLRRAVFDAKPSPPKQFRIFDKDDRKPRNEGFLHQLRNQSLEIGN